RSARARPLSRRITRSRTWPSSKPFSQAWARSTPIASGARTWRAMSSRARLPGRSSGSSDRVEQAPAPRKVPQRAPEDGGGWQTRAGSRLREERTDLRCHIVDRCHAVDALEQALGVVVADQRRGLLVVFP